MKEKECVFCKIIKGELPCYKIYENEYILAFLSIAKEAYGHTLVIPKKHFESVLDCDEFYLQKVTEGLKKVSLHFVENCGFKAVNILNASGREAQQSVFHLHFHLIPRMSESEFDAWPKFTGTTKDLKEQAERLKMLFKQKRIKQAKKLKKRQIIKRFLFLTKSFF